MSGPGERDRRATPPTGAGRPPERPGAPRDNAEHRHHPERDDLSVRLARFLPGLGPAVMRAAHALGVLAPYAPDAHWHAGDPIEQARALEREEEMPLVAAAIALTLCLDHNTIQAHEPRVLTLHSAQRPYSVWWQSRLSPQSLPARPIGPPARADVLRMREPGNGTVTPAAPVAPVAPMAPVAPAAPMPPVAPVTGPDQRSS